MADQKIRGNIIYELLIVILAAALVGSILYPKILQDREDENTRVCRDRMDQILKAELQYLRYMNSYNDTLDNVLNFIKASPEYATYIDTTVVGQLDSIVTKLDEFRAIENHILSNIPMAADTTMIDSLSSLQLGLKVNARALAGQVEVLHDLMKNLPNMPVDDLTKTFLIVDSKEFTIDMDIVNNSIESGRLQDATTGARNVIKVIDLVKAQFESVKAKIPEYRSAGLDSLHLDPSIYQPYVLIHVDTSAIKYLNIYCPIDSMDVEAVKQDFLKTKIGGLDLINHGKIEKGEKSWEST